MLPKYIRENANTEAACFHVSASPLLPSTEHGTTRGCIPSSQLSPSARIIFGVGWRSAVIDERRRR